MTVHTMSVSATKTKKVIEHLRQHGGQGKGWYHAHQDPRPLDEQTRASLTLPDGRPLPPSLHAWLAFDASWFGLMTDTPPRRLKLAPLKDLLRAQARAMTNSPHGQEVPAEESFSDEQMVQVWVGLLPHPAMAEALAVELPPSGSQQHFFVFHQAGPEGEYPIVGFASAFEFWVKYPDFGAYLSHYFGLSKPD
ncbi:hypothetical protein [Myxococcus landrumensis]|uniref:Knr4/Smi1-like domain-containing protein n=1 Tax=Myxococcus landrumensis TaxID=2813577 RepID=A0ABX7MYE6_9BACT|nr:hypothetical protein [Myxococcus landrumus]QSQ11358.1 hypothetical protein JY572_23420 [Myxococcus landrumus]